MSGHFGAPHAPCSACFFVLEREIERTEWARFFESFTTQHDHWLVAVDGENQSLPLDGIIARDELITIRLGGDIAHHRRIVIDAARVLVQQHDGVDRGVSIESRDGHTTRLAFRAPAGTAGA